MSDVNDIHRDGCSYCKSLTSGRLVGDGNVECFCGSRFDKDGKCYDRSRKCQWLEAEAAMDTLTTLVKRETGLCISSYNGNFTIVARDDDGACTMLKTAPTIEAALRNAMDFTEATQ